MTASAPPAPASARYRRPRALLFAGLIGMAIFVAFALSLLPSAKHPWVQGLDDAWRRMVGTGPDAPNWWLPVFFQELGQLGGAVVFILLVPIALLIMRRWRSAVFFLVANLGVTFLVSQLTKNLIHRPRPSENLAEGLYGPLLQVDHGSFPSGHGVTIGFVLIGVAALLPAVLRRWWWLVGGLLVLGMIWQRTLINAHWLSDVVVGVIGGAAGTLLIWWAFATLLEKDRGRPLRRPAR